MKVCRLCRPNVNEQAGAALLDIRHQAIIVEYLLKNVGIFFDKNLASAAIAFYPEADDVTIPVAENGNLGFIFRCVHLSVFSKTIY